MSKGSLSRLYQEKLKTAEQAVNALPRDSQLVTFGCYCGTPPNLTQAFCTAVSNKFFSGIPDVYLLRSREEVVKQFTNVEVLSRIRMLCPFLGAGFRQLADKAKELHKTHPDLIVPQFLPEHFSLYARGVFTRHGKPDVHMLQVSPMDEHGYFSFGADGSMSIPLALEAAQIIVEVNPKMPRTFGAGILHISQIAAITEHESELMVLPQREPSPEDQQIARLVADLVQDNACIQLGIGAVPNEVGRLLKTRNDLGIHTEVLGDTLLELIEAGNVSNRYKQLNVGHSVFNIALFSKPSYYDFLDNNPTMLCHPAEYVNNPHIIAQNDNTVSVNSFVEIDLFGQVASESVNWRQISGSGGQLDFSRGAFLSKGGIAVLAAHSTAKNNSISKVVPRLNNIVTTPRNDVHYVVTEHGCVDLFGLSTCDRAQALIKLAAPKFRDELREEAHKMTLY
ncbi:acetyl-CoA hydrolase/transferase C-terminal domain-containing protein [Pseudovibrio sp. Tun.PSC04-5.I4]|uniref:acetyl-CoA hydrolase/transferase family protein n=1 Tax=Pseudovibrio sp. Tun.PSC04-5.I4 TaxID=1798213 RepID=UPI00088B2D14|nr:acetyl-CoA hydrolase/transferase C-terminal domain-containing protein [Pseudovibrio sp. Tun.PSC04-5.I4]SDR03209.1 itaconate CoA-transferase [Pseudovibrio sp. Tun.PSC04-5.I4]